MVSLFKVLYFNRKFKCSLFFKFHQVFFNKCSKVLKTLIQTNKTFILTKRQYVSIAGVSLYLRK